MKTTNENTQTNMPSGTMNNDSPAIAGDLNSVLMPRGADRKHLFSIKDCSQQPFTLQPKALEFPGRLCR